MPSRPALLIVPVLLAIAVPPALVGIRAARAESRIEAGFGETDITPALGDKPVYMAGFGHNRRAAGVHDRLYARAVVLAEQGRKIALVSVDVVGLFHSSVVNVRHELADFDYVLVSSTHNHEGPDTLGLWGPTPFQNGVDPAYLRLVEERIVDVVRAADAARRPCRAVIGSVRAPELLRDARLPIVKHDDLVVLEFRDDEDRRTGLVVQWNCHPETLDSTNKQISADFVAPVVEHLKQKRGCPVLYLTGTVGGLMTTLKLDVRDEDGKSLADGTFAKTERYGRLLGQAAERALAAAEPVQLLPIEVRRREVYLPLDNRLYLLARQLRVLTRDGYLWASDPYHAEPVDPDVLNKPLCIRTEIGYLRLGQLEIAAIPGEIYPELVLGGVQHPPDPGADFPDAPIEPILYDQMKGRYRMLIGLANDEIGYIIPKRQWDEKPPFCYGRPRAQYGEQNSLGPETAPILCEVFRQLVRGTR